MRGYEDWNIVARALGGRDDTTDYYSNWPVKVLFEKEIRDPVEEYPTKINYHFEGKRRLKNNIRLKMVNIYNRLLFSVSGYIPKGVRRKKCSKQ